MHKTWCVAVNEKLFKQVKSHITRNHNERVHILRGTRNKACNKGIKSIKIKERGKNWRCLLILL